MATIAKSLTWTQVAWATAIWYGTNNSYSYGGDVGRYEPIDGTPSEDPALVSLSATLGAAQAYPVTVTAWINGATGTATAASATIPAGQTTATWAGSAAGAKGIVFRLETTNGQLIDTTLAVALGLTIGGGGGAGSKPRWGFEPGGGRER